MVKDAPGTAVAFLLAALDVCETGAQVAVLGAGPLETLLKAHGLAVIGDLERRRASTPRCATSSPRHGPSQIDPGVWDRLVIAVAPGPVMDADGGRRAPVSTIRCLMRPASPRCWRSRWPELARAADIAKTQAGEQRDAIPLARTGDLRRRRRLPGQGRGRPRGRSGTGCRSISWRTAFMRLPGAR